MLSACAHHCLSGVCGSLLSAASPGRVLELVVCRYACRALCPRGVRPFLVQLQCELASMGAAALAARLGPLRRCSSP